MKIYSDTLKINGCRINKENPQAYLNASSNDVNCIHDGTLTSKELHRFGSACGVKVLPYKMQSGYTRELLPLNIKTIIMENEHLKAVFLPEYGGKLWSLFSKDENRELLFCNSVFRPANLAIRNAWTAGGIEWNLGHTGHSVYTCADVYCTKMHADGEDFLRIYEFEAISEQIMQLDFHLPSGAKQLSVHVRIENTLNSEQPLYWWTNTAVPLEDKTRVFSGTDEVLFQTPYNPRKPSNGFCLGKMPFSPYHKNLDMSFPSQIPISAEYFFQNKRDEPAPWEVCLQNNAAGFFERSTQPLFARKMFCWGDSVGANHWCDFLSEKGKGSYVEIQAGLAPTQLHTTTIAARGLISFTQIFGAFSATPTALTKQWGDACIDVASIVEGTLSARDVNLLDEKFKALSCLSGGEVLHIGSGYAAIERARRAAAGEENFANHLLFELEQDSDFKIWENTIYTKKLDACDKILPYITSPTWLKHLEKLYETSPKATALYYAIALAENRNDAKATEILKTIADNAYALHLMAEIAKRRGELQAAADLYLAAYNAENNTLDDSFAEDAIAALTITKQYARAWELYESIPAKKRTEAQQLKICDAAVKLEKFDFLQNAFAIEYASIREGAQGLADIYQEYLARVKCHKENREFTVAEIDRSEAIPYILNYKMFAATESDT